MNTGIHHSETHNLAHEYGLQQVWAVKVTAGILPLGMYLGKTQAFMVKLTAF